VDHETTLRHLDRALELLRKCSDTGVRQDIYGEIYDFVMKVCEDLEKPDVYH
jgi:hypothetical protein